MWEDFGGQDRRTLCIAPSVTGLERFLRIQMRRECLLLEFLRLPSVSSVHTICEGTRRRDEST